MADPFDILGGPDRPADPDPAFATRLRTRLERSLQLPRGVTVSNTVVLPETTTEAGRPTGPLTPYLAVAGAEEAIAFYTDVLGATVAEGPIVMPDGRIGHAGLRLPGGADLMLSEEHPEIGVSAPAPGAGATVSLHLVVDDVDGLVARAVDAGAILERAPDDNPYGRIGVIRDPWGHRWMFNDPAPRPDRRPGDTGYVSLWVPDADAARRFFATVLGWEYSETGRQVLGRSLHHGLEGGRAEPTLFMVYAVADLDDALGRVEAAGGSVGARSERPEGRTADCTDDQGTRFALYQPTEGVAPASDDVAEPPLTQGDLAYVTYRVMDADAFRSFYGAVLGWRFRPGHVPDGWQIEGPHPMGGVHGGNDRATTVPMYAVDDIDAAVARVRAAGGSASDPEQHPYGRTSLCHDDQGTELYLGQLV